MGVVNIRRKVIFSAVAVPVRDVNYNSEVSKSRHFGFLKFGRLLLLADHVRIAHQQNGVIDKLAGCI